MDYSASIQENEDPAGTSPWGHSPMSSPQHSRTAFEDIPDSTPSFPYVAPPHNELEPTAESEGFQRPGPATTEARIDVAPDAPVIRATTAVSDSSGLPPAYSTQQLPSANPPTEQSGHIGATRSQSGQAQQLPKACQPQLRLQAKISGLERTGKKDPVLRFDIHTNLPRFRTTQYRDVRRLHSEFFKLADHLVSANPEVFVPAVPPAVTAAGAGTEEDELRVKATMQRWFNYVCSNEALIKDDEMMLFVESDFGYSPMVKRKQPATGMRRKILKQFAPPPDDTPELAEARPTVKLFYLGAMDAGHKVDKLVKARRGLGLAESDFGIKMSTMHVQEPHPGLANAYKKLGKIIQTVGDYHAAQATAEAAAIGDPFQYHSQDAFVVKESLTNRQILTREFLQAQETTRSKLNAADRLKASSSVRREKVDEAIAALDEARHMETTLFHKTTRVTQNLVLERRKWFTRTAADLRISVRDFVLREIEAERRTLAVLEAVRPDIRSIDASGGLSRLGRESHPTARRSSLAASQGPKGDSWSGVPRRSDASSRTVSGSLIGKLAEEADGEGDDEPNSAGCPRASLLGASEDDEDRIDARNAASRLATSSF